MKHWDYRLRLLHLGAVYLGSFLFLAWGLFWRQILQTQRYKDQEKQQSQRRILQPGPRGHIYDRNGQLLVGNRPGFSVVLYLGELRQELRQEYLKKVREARQARQAGGQTHLNRDSLRADARAAVVQRYLEHLEGILGRKLSLDKPALLRHFAQKLLLPFPLARDLSDQEYVRLWDALPIDSPMQLHGEAFRYYPFGCAAAHVLGNVGPAEATIDAFADKKLTTFSFKTQTGRSGLELVFDASLQGKNGGSIWQVDPSGFQYRCLESVIPQKGQDLHITIDIELQRVAEAALGARRGAVVLLDIATGEVLVMASKPDYDLNAFVPTLSVEAFRAISENEAWMNRALQGLYPPGSPFKLITAMAALKAGVITPETRFDCDRFYKVGNRLYPEHDKLALGSVDLKEALSMSSNVYCYQVGLQVGPEALAKEAAFWHLNSPTGIELPFEPQQRSVPDPQWKLEKRHERWYPGDTANMAIGQGFLLTTPLRMACFAAALGSGNPGFQPTLLKKESTNALQSSTLPASGAHGLKPSDYQALLAGMRQAATQGTGRLIAIHGSDICVKTGTAQIANNTLTLAWLIGFYYATHTTHATQESLPTVALCVLVEGADPNDGYAGSTTAAPIGRTVLRAYQKAKEKGGKD